MEESWLYRTTTAFPNKRLFRLGLSASYGIDEDGVRAAMDRGVNFFVWTMRAPGMKRPLLAALSARREAVAVAGFASIGWFGWGVRSGAERLLRSLGTDYLDLFLLGWLGVGSALTSATERDLVHLRESGKVRAIGVSIHDRVRAGELASRSPLDLWMIRYNAAHPGAERDIFPHVRDAKPTRARVHRHRVAQALEEAAGLVRLRDDGGRLLPLSALKPARRPRAHGAREPEGGRREPRRPPERPAYYDGRRGVDEGVRQDRARVT
jgi:hypothetical protein